MLLGVVGAPNKGKSTLFSAATLVQAKIADYPFTTIDPNKGVTYFQATCPHLSLHLQKCDPHNSRCENGIRLIPINMIDVAGLVPGAHEGKGMGNEFLGNLSEADALIQIIDASGNTNCEGNPSPNFDPAEEILFLEKEIEFWIDGILKRAWPKLKGKNIQDVAKILSGLHVSEKETISIAEQLGLATEKMNWTEEERFSFSQEVRKVSKPVIIAANKIDLPGAKENYKKLKERFPDKIIIPCFADGELALRKAADKGLIHYTPGAADFTEVNVNPAQKHALDKIRGVMKQWGGTGVQQCINAAVQELLDLIEVYPVEDESKFCNNFGKVLPDSFLLPRGSTPLDLAAKIHTDLAKHFISAVNCRTKMRVGKDYQLQPGDIIKIVAGK
ncbi:Ribosome-binding ATPase YchF [Candidatus Gugararchaeum adminiculabundum]|nr:Ribosome-binding ATPase YchF [Candidatus Gugararchaeum adminiculabundum]